MDVLLIRHGKKIPTLPDEDAPLSPEGLDQVDRLKERMTSLGLNPEVYLTSKYKRARETAERLSPNSTVIHPLDILTPKDSTLNLDASQVLAAISGEAQSRGIDLGQQTVIAIVGHEPQLSRILTHITSKSEMSTGTGVQVEADSFSTIVQGKGQFSDRID